MGVLLHVGTGHDAHQTCAKIQDPGSGILTDPRSWVGVLIQDPVDRGSCPHSFCGILWILDLVFRKLDPGDPRFAPRELIGSGGYSRCELPLTFFGSRWKDTGNTMSRILKDVAYCIGIFLRDLVDSESCRLFVV